MGIYFYSNVQYLGDFKKGVKKGKGTYFYENSSKYEGNFKNDMMNGEGIFFDKKTKYKVIMENDKMITRDRINLENIEEDLSDQMIIVTQKIILIAVIMIIIIVSILIHI